MTRYQSALSYLLLTCSLAPLHAAHLPDDVKKNAATRITKALVDHAKLAAGNTTQRNGFWAADTNVRNIFLMIGEATAGPGDPDPDMAARVLVPVMESARTDKQVGSGASASGSTNLVTKGSLPAILGFAVENGALSRTVSGTTVTFQGSPNGILNALQGKGFLEGYRDDENVPFLKALRHTAFSVTFDTSRDSPPDANSTAATGTTSTPNPFTGSSRQVSEYSFRLALLNKRDPRDKTYRPLWDQIAAGALQQTAIVANEVVQAVAAHRKADPALDKRLADWQADFRKSLAATDGSDAAVNPVVTDAITSLETIVDDITVFGNLKPYAAAVQAFSADRTRVLKQVSKGTIATYEFTNTRQVSNPDLLNHRLVFETDLLKNGKSDFTLNASFTHFSTTDGLPAKTKSIRDYQFGAQIDVPVASMVTGPNGGFENWMLTGSWRYMRLLESQKIPLTDFTAPTGVINLIQGKLTVPIKDGIKVPLAVTWSNRTELVPHHSDFRVNLGVLFDSGVLFSRLKP
jgi:hypothetical protein